MRRQAGAASSPRQAAFRLGGEGPDGAREYRWYAPQGPEWGWCRSRCCPQATSRSPPQVDIAAVMSRRKPKAGAAEGRVREARFSDRRDCKGRDRGGGRDPCRAGLPVRPTAGRGTAAPAAAWGGRRRSHGPSQRKAPLRAGPGRPPTALRGNGPVRARGRGAGVWETGLGDGPAEAAQRPQRPAPRPTSAVSIHLPRPLRWRRSGRAPRAAARRRWR